MSNKYLCDVSCFRCGKQRECIDKIERSSQLLEICEYQMNRWEFKNCPIYISLTCPEMEDLS